VSDASSPLSATSLAAPGAGGQGLARRAWCEPLLIAAAWLVLVACSLFVFPLADLPASWSSWDVLHSGRRFADQGFMASRLQPRWVPMNDPAPYVTYTHYPPLPYWISGVVQSAVFEPQRRIHAMMHLTRLVAVTGLLLGYLLLRQFSVSPGAAAVSVAMLTWSQRWWGWVSGELSWCSWWPLFLFGIAAAFIWGFRRPRSWRVALAAGTACCAAAALSAFDAWLWAPTFLAALLCLAPRHGASIRRRLLVALLCVCAATGFALATRIAINWWYYGSLDTTVRDLREAYQVRSAGERSDAMTHENAVNYWDVGTVSKLRRWELAAHVLHELPTDLVLIYLPAPPFGSRIGPLIGLAALAGWAMVARRRRDQHPPASAWPTAPRALVAFTAAPIAFVLACPAITNEQPWGLLGFAPAVLLVAGMVWQGALTPLARAIGTSGASALAAAAALGMMIVRLPTAYGHEWPRPFDECQAATRAIADLDGPVFVNFKDANPFMYLLPLDSRVALKPAWAFKRFLRDTRPVRLLFAESVPQGERLPGLPPAWSFVVLEDGSPLGTNRAS